MNELSLFTGAGGGVLASHLLGWRTIGYVEIDDYCQRVLRARIDDGILDEAPIFGDIRAFNEQVASMYKGVVDVITAGFPCQPFSQAGQRKGADDERNMWPATIECIRTIRPRYAFLENVRGLLSSVYFGRILGDLAESGYDARWRILSAAEVGAPHRRDRLWVVAYPTSDIRRESGDNGPEPLTGRRNDLADACSSRQHRQNAIQPHPNINGKHPAQEQSRSSVTGVTQPDCQDVAVTEGTRPPQPRGRGGETTASTGPPDTGWWSVEPDVGRVADGVASRVDRLKALGNGQVPGVAALAWRLLTS